MSDDIPERGDNFELVSEPWLDRVLQAFDMSRATHSTHGNHRVTLGVDYEVQSSDDHACRDAINPRWMPNDGEWWHSYDNVTRLGRHLADVLGVSAERLQGYYETPWRFVDEWRELDDAS